MFLKTPPSRQKANHEDYNELFNLLSEGAGKHVE